MSVEQALFVPGATAFLVALFVLGSWLEVRLRRAEQQLRLVPVEAESDAGRPSAEGAGSAA